MSENNNIFHLPHAGSIMDEINKLKMENSSNRVRALAWCLIRADGTIAIGGNAGIYRHNIIMAKGLARLIERIRT